MANRKGVRKFLTRIIFLSSIILCKANFPTNNDFIKMKNIFYKKFFIKTYRVDIKS